MESEVRSSVGKAANEMGYSLKQLQEDIIVKFALGSDVFVSLLLGSVRAYVLLVCQECLIFFENTKNLGQ